MHEVLTWATQPDNNPVMKWFGPDLSAFHEACEQLIRTQGTVLPKGSLKARVRFTTRESTRNVDELLGDTLGDESEGLVMVDFQGHPIRYDQLSVLEQVVAKDRCRFELQVQTEESHGRWRNVGSTGELSPDTPWRQDLLRGARELQDLQVKAGDPHYDAKLFPCVHPYGSGTLGSRLKSPLINACLTFFLTILN